MSTYTKIKFPNFSQHEDDYHAFFINGPDEEILYFGQLAIVKNYLYMQSPNANKEQQCIVFALKNALEKV